MATSIDQSNYVKTALRLPPEVHAAVHESAQKNGRSYNAELVDLVQQSLTAKAQVENQRTLETSLIAVQTMLAFHLREFYDLLPEAVQRKPGNQAVRNLAFAIGHGSSSSIEETLRTYFQAGEGAAWFRQVAETLHERRTLLDEDIRRHPSKDPEPIEKTVEHIRAKP